MGPTSSRPGRRHHRDRGTPCGSPGRRSLSTPPVGSCGAWRLAVVVMAGAFVVTTIPGVRSTVGFDPILDGWLQGGSYALLAALAWTRPLLFVRDRGLWASVATAVTFRALGFLLFLAVVRERDPLPYPSVADAAWLAVPLAFLLSLWLLARHHSQRLSVTLVLDALSRRPRGRGHRRRPVVRRPRRPQPSGHTGRRGGDEPRLPDHGRGAADRGRRGPHHGAVAADAAGRDAVRWASSPRPPWTCSSSTR